MPGMGIGTRPHSVQRAADIRFRVNQEQAVQHYRFPFRQPCTNTGLMLLYFDRDRWQMATRPYYGEVVKRILDTRRNAPLSPAALEVLAIIAYNQPVSRSFIEQVRGVDSSSTVSKLMERGLIEEAGRLDLPGKPVAFRVTDTFLRVFGLGSLADLPPLHDDPQKEEELPVQQTLEELQ